MFHIQVLTLCTLYTALCDTLAWASLISSYVHLKLNNDNSPKCVQFLNSVVREAAKNILRGGLLQSRSLRPQNDDPPIFYQKVMDPP